MTKTVSVLNKMPRDCTAQPSGAFRMYSPFGHEVSNTMTRKTRNKSAQGGGQANMRAIKALTQQVKSLKLKGASRSANKTPFADVGSHLGGIFGMKDLGRGVGGVIGRILGSGDYVTNFDSVRSNTLTSPVPAFGNERTTITHREYIGDVVSSAVAGAFKLEKYRINPADSGTFPWLATMATNFEEYSIDGMIFEFKTTSGNSVASTNTSLGTVVLATQYDPTRASFTNKQEMENHYFAQSTVPSNSVLHAVECKKGESPLSKLYIADTTDPGYDPRFSDYGNFSIATVGMPGVSVNLGELWVSYRVSLAKPRLSDIHDGTTNRAGRSIVSTANPLGTTSLYSKGLIPVTVTNTTISIVAQPSDAYFVTLIWTGAGVVGAAAPSQALTGCSYISGMFNNGAGNIVFAGNGGTVTTLSSSFYLRSNSASSESTMTVTFGVAGVLPGSANLDILVTSVSALSVA